MRRGASLSLLATFFFPIPIIPQGQEPPSFHSPPFCPVYQRFSTINFLGLFKMHIYIVLNGFSL